MMTEQVVNTFPDTRLKRLFWLRNASIAGQMAAVVVASSALAIELPLLPLGLIIAALVCANSITAWQLGRARLASDIEIFGQLCVDVVLLTAALYLTGGATNPFVSLYLLPLTIAATALSMRYTWAMAALTVTAYTLLLFWYQPIGQDHSHHSYEFGLHVLGMWFNFIVSAVLIAFFVTRMAESLRARDRELASARERALRDQQLVMLGTFATGAAHELGTPLSTMAVIAKDLQEEHAGDRELARDLQTLRNQLDACKTILTGLVGRTGHARAENARAVGLRDLIDEASNRWRVLRPESQLLVRYAASGELPSVVSEDTMVQALVSLLNNAADASPERVELLCIWSKKEVTLEIRDKGHGLTENARHLAGRVAYTEKPGRGLGLGLLLAKATVERLGGRMELRNREEGGAATRVTLPITLGGTA
jgi:two-component system sensor histidine kinase RegB